MRIPSVITAGDSTSWTDPALRDPQGNVIDSGSYTLSYSLRGPATQGLDLQGTPAGSGWSFAFNLAASAALNAGSTPLRWFWQAYASKSGVRLTVGQGTLLVKPNLAAISNATYEGRSEAEVILAQINATIKARTAGTAVAEYTIDNRSMKYMAVTELLELRGRYQLIVKRERRKQMAANGLGRPDILGVRFK